MTKKYALFVPLWLGFCAPGFAFEEVPQSALDTISSRQQGEAAATEVQPVPASAVGAPAAGSLPASPTASVAQAATGRTPTARAAAPRQVSPVADVDMETVEVLGRSANLLGKAESGSSGSVDQADLGHRAILRPAEVLEAVPGLLITQHSGDGKANQYFTRGFNLDHGTDFAFFMEGVPVNEQSNAHGQGYSDINFLIPELVTNVTYAKGPVSIEAGDFNTAGSANFSYPTVLKQGVASLTLGDYGYQRALAASQLPVLDGNLIYALEIGNYDGPWAVPEDNRKYNGLLRFSAGPSDGKFTLSASAYEASWTATNQVPASAIADGEINQFGSLNPTDGGERRRDFVWGGWTGKTGGTETDLLAYVGVSHMILWNDFTYYLYNPQGDQFEEFDERTREGGTARYKFPLRLFGADSKNELGADFRNDNITALKLYNTVDRVPWGLESANQVIETSGGPYFKNTAQWTPWLRSEVGFRQDFFDFNVLALDATQLEAQNQPAMAGAQGGQKLASLPEPKAGLSLRPGEGPLEIYLNYDWGFHSNDARSITPFSIKQNGGDAPSPLAQAKGEELGFRFAKGETYESTLAFWYLDMASELTFDGDTAQSDINNASYRKGLEWSNTFRAKPLFLDLDYALSQARFSSVDVVDDPNHPGNWVPEAIKNVATATLGLDQRDGWSADARVRYFGARDLTADGSAATEAPASTLVSLHLARALAAGQSINLDIFNLFDVTAADVSYYYAYSLRYSPALAASPNSAPESIMEHNTEPRSFRVSWVDRF